jgi:2'-5' RNA ligase
MMDHVARMQSSDSSENGNSEKSSAITIGNRHAYKTDGTTNGDYFRDEYRSKTDPRNSQDQTIPTKRQKKGLVDIIRFSHAIPETFQRSTPHRRGHWAGHVKIPVTSSLWIEKRKRSIRQYQQFLERRGHSGTLVEHEDVHVSLSKPFSLQVSQVESFVQQLKVLLQDMHSTNIHVDTAGIVLVNEEETRSFWCWTVRANPTLLQLVRQVDSVLARYQQPSYYDPPHFHISVASFPGKVYCEEGDHHGDDTYDNWDDASASSSSSTGVAIVSVPVNQLQCTFGTTKQFLIPLKGCNS